jgi:RNA polymerase sigma-70 factor (ECF subfamily)
MAPATASCLRDETCFRSLYRDHAPGVRRVALSVVGDTSLAEDVTQDVFIHVWRKPERWNPERGDLGVYLRILARSRAVDALRSAGAARRARERLELAEAAADRVSVADATSQVAERSTVRAAVAELPRGQREAVALAFWGELTTREIARACELPHGTVKSRVRLGLSKLRSRKVIRNA